jgi:transcriptional regulator with XRE-family HTH domain
METGTRQQKNSGRKVTRVREILGVKQDVLAERLGLTQQAISRIELAENIEDATIERIANALGIESEVIKNFNEDAAVNVVQNNYDGANPGAMVTVQNENHNCTFNPLEKYVEVVEKNEKLHEALLKSEREKIVLLERMLEMKK